MGRLRDAWHALRGYAAAQDSRTSSWAASGGSATAEVGAAAPTVARRARDAVRNDPYAARIVDLWTGNAVGAGITTRRLDKPHADGECLPGDHRARRRHAIRPPPAGRRPGARVVHRQRRAEARSPRQLDPTKARPERKVDTAVALIIAIGRAMVEPERATSVFENPASGKIENGWRRARDA